MSIKIVIKALDGLLGPLGFERRKHTWRRNSGPFVDLIDVQISKGGDSLTLNAGVLDPEVFVCAWGAHPDVVQEPDCSVRARVSDLASDRKGVWMPLDAPETPELAVEAISVYMLPFLERMHTRETMQEWLMERGVLRRPYPPPIIYLAILMYLTGDDQGAFSVLDRLHASTNEGWRTRVDEVRARLVAREAGAGR